MHCNEDREKKRMTEGAYRNPDILESLEKKMTQSILIAKKDHMTKMYMEYLDTYKNEKPKLASNIENVYKDEMSNIKNALMAGNSRASPLLAKAANSRKSSTIDHIHMRRTASNQPTPIRSDWKIRMTTRRQSCEELTQQQVGELAVKRVKMSKELDNKINQKIEDAIFKRDEFLENRVQRIHTDHVSLCFYSKPFHVKPN